MWYHYCPQEEKPCRDVPSYLIRREPLLPTSPSNLSFIELQRLAECYGFEFARSRGSHFNYRHPKGQGVVSIQRSKNGEAKEYQVKQVLKLIESLEDESGG